MKKSRFTEEQIIGILKQHESGVKTADLCREHGISAATFYSWKSKFGGMEVSEAQRLKAIEDENRRLKLLVAELSLHGEALKAVIRKNGWSLPVRADTNRRTVGWSKLFRLYGNDEINQTGRFRVFARSKRR